MITKKDICNGLNNKKVTFIIDPNMKSGTVCQIGNNWFYFGGETAEEMSPEEYIKNVPIEDIVNEIFETLEDFKKYEDFIDEYKYYEYYLTNK